MKVADDDDSREPEVAKPGETVACDWLEKIEANCVEVLSAERAPADRLYVPGRRARCHGVPLTEVATCTPAVYASCQRSRLGRPAPSTAVLTRERVGARKAELGRAYS